MVPSSARRPRGHQPPQGTPASPAASSGPRSAAVRPPLTMNKAGPEWISWRRGWDSNPRYPFGYNGFRDRPLQPLAYLSAGGIPILAQVAGALPPEELHHQGPALLLAHAAPHVEPMVEAQVFRAHHGADGAELRLVLSVHEAIDARVERRAEAHHARLHRHVEGRAREPIVAGGGGGLPEGDDLGVGGRIVGRDRLVEPFADDLTARDEHGPDRDLARGQGQAGLGERHLHVFVVVAHGQWLLQRFEHSAQEGLSMAVQQG